MNLDLFDRGDRVICAVSGGADSMALLWSLFLRQEELGIHVSAAHFNHRLRGAESDRDEQFVRDFCTCHGISLTVGSGDVATFAKEHSLSTEEAARALRYAFFDTLDCEKIALAHHAQDHAETVLHHMMRGSGMRGLCGIASKRGKYIRPFLDVDRAEIEAFLLENNIPWMQDSTNESDDYTRNRIRHEILPLFLRENPNFLRTIRTQSEILRQEDEILDNYAKELLLSAKDGERYRCETILTAPEALQKRALRLIMREKLPQDVASNHISQMQKLLQNPSPSATLSLPHGLVMRRIYDRFTVEEAASEQAFEPFILSQSPVFLPCGWKIEWKITENLQNFKNSSFQFALSYDMITKHDLLVRSRKSGDALTLSCTKSLKKWLIEKKIPRHEREILPVFDLNGQVCAVAGLGVDRAFAAESGEKAIVISVEYAV